MKENLRNNKTNILLSNALIELMKEKDFDNIKLNEICERALVHKTTFYNHFEDKYDLLNYVIKGIQKNIKENVNTDKGIIEYYLSIAREYIKIIKDNPDIYTSILKSNANGICLYIFYDTFVNDVENEISKIKNIGIPYNYIAKFYVSAVFALVNDWVINGMNESEEEIIRYLEILIKSEKQG